jgi:DNA topoisomerase-1
MDETLDAIANGREDAKAYLRRFFLGDNGTVGLKRAVDERKRSIPYPAAHIGAHPETGEPIVVRWGKDGRPFLQLGDKKSFANIPDEVAPDELTVSKALELFDGKRDGPESIGIHPTTARRLLLKRRGDYYLEVERTPEEIEKKVKPVWVSLPSGVDPRSLSQEDLDYLCSLPMVIGRHPDSGDQITFRIGKYGPYIQCGKEIRNSTDWRGGATMSVNDAVALLAQDKRAASRSQASREPIQVFGELPGAAGSVKVMPGRFGPYVTDGTTNATLPKNVDPSKLTPEQAVELLQKKAAAGPSPRRGRFSKRTGSATSNRRKSK